jgi:hypothetical protein
MPQIRSDPDETSTPDTCTGFQGQGGAGRHQGKTPAELAQQYDVQPNQITAWKAQVMGGGRRDFWVG